MTISDLQKTVRDFHSRLKRDALSPENRILDIASEAGELAKEVLKITAYGSKSFSTSESLGEELGDLLYSVLSLCEECGLKAEDLLNESLRKYEKRIQTTGQLGSSA